MRVTRVEPIILRWPEPNDAGHERMTVLVRVATDAGVEGWGEGIAMWPEACAATASIVTDGLAPLLRGEDATAIDRHWRAMKAHCWWYGEGGVANFAIAAIDMALWDLSAKERGVPLLALLGGSAHDTLPACASLHVNQPTLEDSVRQIARHVADGFASVKLGLGKRGPSRAGRDPDFDVALVAGLRAEIGEKPSIMVDAGNGTTWDLPTATRTVRRMEQHGIAWIEEPFHPSRVADHVALRQAVSTRIAAGEREWSVAGYERWLAAGCIDVYGIDPGRSEGVTGFRAAAKAIEAAGRTVNAHAWSTAVLTAASLHLSLASPACELFELKPLPGPMQFELVESPFWHEDGLVRAPARPGHGAEPREAALARYRVT